MLRGLGDEEGAAGSAVVPFGMKVQVGSKQAWQSWVGRNKWGVLFSSMAMAHVLRTSEPSSTNSTGSMTSIDTFGTLASLCVMFIVGVSTGFLWKAYGKTDNHQVLKAQQKTETRAATTPTKELFQVAAREEPPSTPPVPRARTSAVGIVRQYSLSEVMEMTDDCKIELGRGGQGVVYFANLLPLGDGKHAAVKRLQKSANFLMVESLQSRETVEREFWSELNTISRLHHRNLVALLGYCIEDDDLFLVYEYMAGGSLDQHLHKNEDGVCRLDWKARLRCAVEVAQGLEYLHSHANPSLVHRDIKSGNILFDDEMHAKIADFGLSKPLSPGQDPTISTRVRGTHGYVDPEYLMTGQPSNKNDVYSYGVVLLELITGRKAIQKKVSLVTWCKDFLAADEVLMRHLLTKIVDSRIVPVDEAQERQLLDVVMVAKECVLEKQDMRPSMQDVVAALYNANSKDYSTSDSEASNDVSPASSQSLLLCIHQWRMSLTPITLFSFHSSVLLKHNKLHMESLFTARHWKCQTNFYLTSSSWT